MKIVYYSSILAGVMDSPELSNDDDVEANGSDKLMHRASSQIPQVIVNDLKIKPTFFEILKLQQLKVDGTLLQQPYTLYATFYYKDKI